MEDADLDLAVSAALGGAYGGTGQKCTASSRLVVHHAIHDAFVDKVIAGAKAMVVGHALHEGTQIGPVVSAQQLQENLDYVALGQAEGAELACGGARLEMPTEGFYMSPGLFIGSSNSMRINREEMFAPLAAVIKVAAMMRLFARCGRHKPRTTSGIVTKDLARATHFRQHAKPAVSWLTAYGWYGLSCAICGRRQLALTATTGSYAAEFIQP